MNENINKNTEKKTWRIPVYWTMTSIMEIEADTIEDAIQIAQEDDGPLPTDGEYLDGTWEVDLWAEEIRDLYNNGQKDN